MEAGCRCAFAVTMVITGIPQTTYAKEYWPKGPSVEAKSAIVMEVNTGTILYEKKSHTKRFPASITKIMTTLLAIENCDMDEKVTFRRMPYLKMREIHHIFQKSW